MAHAPVAHDDARRPIRHLDCSAPFAVRAQGRPSPRLPPTEGFGEKMMAEAAWQCLPTEKSNKPKTKKTKHHALFSAGDVRSHSSHHPISRAQRSIKKYKCTYHDAECGGEGGAFASATIPHKTKQKPWLVADGQPPHHSQASTPHRILRTPAYSAPFAQCSSPTSFDRSHLMRPLSAYRPATPDRP